LLRTGQISDFGPDASETLSPRRGLRTSLPEGAAAPLPEISREMERFDCLTNFEDGGPVNQRKIPESTTERFELSLSVSER
jgi:hypothetical protein